MEARFDAIVFAGGGCRCLWQAGFWETASPALAPLPQSVAAVSAGAAMACMVIGGATAAGVAEFKRRVSLNRRNAYPWNVFHDEPVFPHARLYREAMLEIADDRFLARLHAGPEIRIAVARPPLWLGHRTAMLAAFAAYQVEKMRGDPVHATVARRLGFLAESVSVRDCRSPAELADLILHSSCTPPFTPFFRRAGRPVLDGGLVDNAPIGAVPPQARSVLVLLTRPFPEALLPKVAGRTYVKPSAPIPVYKWDYTSPSGLQAAFDLGRRDGESFARAAQAAARSPDESRWSPPGSSSTDTRRRATPSKVS